MKKLLALLMLLPVALAAQSDGSGKISPEKPDGLKETALFKDVGKTTRNSDNKFKNGTTLRIFEWFDYRMNELPHRYRRDFLAESHFYDEDLIGFSEEAELSDAYTYHVRLNGKKIETEVADDLVWVYGEVKVYNPYDGLLQSTIYFENGRPTRININHYYANNQLQFVREMPVKALVNRCEMWGCWKPIIRMELFLKIRSPKMARPLSYSMMPEKWKTNAPA